MNHQIGEVDYAAWDANLKIKHLSPNNRYSAIKCKNIAAFYKAPGRASPASKVWTWIYICCGDGHVDLKLIRCGMVTVRRVDNEYKQKTCQGKNLLNQPETEENTQKKNNPQNKTGTAP